MLSEYGLVATLKLFKSNEEWRDFSTDDANC